MDIAIDTVVASGPFGPRVMYDLSINGRAIKGARHFTKAEATKERDEMLRSLTWKNGRQFLE